MVLQKAKSEKQLLAAQAAPGSTYARKYYRKIFENIFPPSPSPSIFRHKGKILLP